MNKPRGFFGSRCFGRRASASGCSEENLGLVLLWGQHYSCCVPGCYADAPIWGCGTIVIASPSISVMILPWGTMTVLCHLITSLPHGVAVFVLYRNFYKSWRLRVHDRPYGIACLGHDPRLPLARVRSIKASTGCGRETVSQVSKGQPEQSDNR